MSSSSSSRSSVEDPQDDETFHASGMVSYHLIGALCFCGSIIIGIACVLVTSLLTALTDLSNQVLGIIFGLFFGGFLLFLFMCLCCTYYLGASKESWKTPEFDGIRKNFVNFVALAGLIIEFLQICSFSFNRTRQFAGLDLRWFNYLAVPVGERENPDSFESIYWAFFVVAFTPYMFVITVRLIIYVHTLRYGESSAANIVEKFQEKIHSVLWFLVNALYFPVIGTMIAGTDCTYQGDSITLDSDNRIECLRGKHIAILVCSQLALIIYYPAASFAQAQTQNISDIKFKPRVVFIMLQGKFLMAAISIYFTSNYIVYFTSLLILNLMFLLLNLLGQPCLVSWVNQMRTVLFAMVLWATFCSGVVSTWILNDETDPLPGFLLIAGWVLLLVALPPTLYFLTPRCKAVHLPCIHNQ